MFNVGLPPITQLGVPAAPFCQPGGQVIARFLQVAPVIKPPQFGQTIIVVAFTRQVIQRVTKKMHIAALPGRFG